MKPIEIKCSLENEFLQAVKLSGLSVKKLAPQVVAGKVLYRITSIGVSQHQIFTLGVYFAQLTHTQPEETFQSSLF